MPAPAPAPAPSPVPVSGALTLSGADTAAFGTTLELGAFAYGRQDLTGYKESLIATTNTPLLAVLTQGAPLPAVAGTAAVVIGSELGISMRLSREGHAKNWLYVTQPCQAGAIVVPCGDIAFDLAKRTATFAGATVRPVIGGPENSLSTAPLTLTGTLSWTAADE